MSNPAWTRVIRSRPGIATTTVVAFIAVGTYVATGGFGDPDTANPVVRIAAVASPVDGTETLTAVCIDTGGCASVTFKLDGDDLSTDSSSPFAYDWDTTTAPDGTRALTASAVDVAGNAATSSARRVDVENGRANIWVNTVAGASPSRCSTACAYDSTHAYGGFNAAAGAASADDLILVRDGTYPAQTVNDSPSGTDAITIRSNNGQAFVTTGSLGVVTSYVTVDGFTTAANDPTGDTGYGLTGIVASDDTAANPRTENHITYQNIVTHSAYIATDDVTLRHVVIGPSHACNILDAGGGEDGILISTDVAAQGSAENITFDDVTVHDIDRWQDGVQSHGICDGPSGEPHTDGMQVFSGDGVTIENSHFYDNATSNILARPCCNGSPVLDNWVMENNEFGPTLEGGNDVLLGASGENCHGSNDFLLQNNTFAAGGARLGCTGTPAVARSNIFYGPYVCNGIERNATYTYSAFGVGSDSSCTGSSHAVTCDPTWADPTHTDGNWDTAASDTCARDAGDPVDFPALDIHGVSRPVGPAPDAGANEGG